MTAQHKPQPMSDEAIRDEAKSCGLDWQRGYIVSDEDNRFEHFARAIEAAMNAKWTKVLRAAVLAERAAITEMWADHMKRMNEAIRARSSKEQP